MRTWNDFLFFVQETKKQHHDIVSVYRMHLLYAVQVNSSPLFSLLVLKGPIKPWLLTYKKRVLQLAKKPIKTNKPESARRVLTVSPVFVLRVRWTKTCRKPWSRFWWCAKCRAKPRTPAETDRKWAAAVRHASQQRHALPQDEEPARHQVFVFSSLPFSLVIDLPSSASPVQEPATTSRVAPVGRGAFAGAAVRSICFMIRLLFFSFFFFSAFNCLYVYRLTQSKLFYDRCMSSSSVIFLPSSSSNRTSRKKMHDMRFVFSLLAQKKILICILVNSKILFCLVFLFCFLNRWTLMKRLRSCVFNGPVVCFVWLRRFLSVLPMSPEVVY